MYVYVCVYVYIYIYIHVYTYVDPRLEDEEPRVPQPPGERGGRRRHECPSPSAAGEAPRDGCAMRPFQRHREVRLLEPGAEHWIPLRNQLGLEAMAQPSLSGPRTKTHARRAVRGLCATVAH